MIPPRPYGYRTLDQHDITRLKLLLSITPRGGKSPRDAA